MTTTLTGISGMAFSRDIFPFTHVSSTESSIKKSERKLIATTDYNDNVGYRGSNCFFEKKHLDDLHKYLSSIGVSRHQWIYNPLESIYDSYPMGFDLLKEAADSAHAHGLEFYAQIKVFEGGASGNIYPHTKCIRISSSHSMHSAT